MKRWPVEFEMCVLRRKDQERHELLRETGMEEDLAVSRILEKLRVR